MAEIRIKVNDRPDHEAVAARLHGIRHLRYEAEAFGPWYDDSNPVGQGVTAEEAVADVRKALAELRNEITVFLEKP